MKQQPSLLDYLKALLDPRIARIQLSPLEPDAAEQSATADSGGIAMETQSAASPVFRDAEADSHSETVEISPEEPARPVPWRSMAAVILAMAAQVALEPPDRLLSMGVFFYAAAIVLGAWGWLAGEFAFPEIPGAQYRKDRQQVRGSLILAALPLTVLAFFALSGNQFTSFNLTIWLGALFLLCWGLWNRAEKPFSLRDAFAVLRPPYHVWISGWTLLFLFFFAVTMFFRFYQLDSVPLQMFSDHAEKLQDVQDVLNGETRIFFPRNTGREFVQMYLTAFTAKVLGYNLTFMALKMGTALAGILTLPFIYLLGKELANRRVGLFAMLLGGMSYWLNVVTRVALRFSLYPLFVVPTLFFVVRGLRRGNRNDFIWAGIFLGLGLHGYSPFRFVPILVVLAVLLFVLHVRSESKRMQSLWHLVIVGAISLIVFLPLLRFMMESEANWSIVMYRGMTRLSGVETPLPDSGLKIFAENMWRSMTMFAWENGNTWVHSVVFRPALDVVSGGLFYLGYFLIFVRYLRNRKWEDVFLLLSVPFLLLPSALSLAFPSENPSLNRSGGAIIPVFIIAAMSLDGLLMSIRKWLGSQGGRIAAWAVVGMLLFWSSLINYDLVFRQYNDQFRRSAWNTTELGQVIRSFADSVGTEDSAWVVPYPHWVDTRLVGINAGVYIRDYALPRDQILASTAVQGPKLYLFNISDQETRDTLFSLYPGGHLTEFISDFEGKNFMVFFADTP